MKKITSPVSLMCRKSAWTPLAGRFSKALMCGLVRVPVRVDRERLPYKWSEVNYRIALHFQVLPIGDKTMPQENGKAIGG